MAQRLFCGQCGTQGNAGASFCGNCGALMPKVPAQPPPPSPPPPQYQSKGTGETKPCIPLLKNGSWADALNLRLFSDSGKASYRVGEVKTRDFWLSYLGNFVIIKNGRSETYGSASENIVNLREIKRSGQDVTLTFKSHYWTLTTSSPAKALDLVKACATLGMILYQGPPSFQISDDGQKASLESLHLFETPNDEWLISQNLPAGWELCYLQNPGQQVTPYYVDHKTQATHWTLPPDVMELISLAKIKKYPRFLADQGFFMSMRMWCAYLYWMWGQIASGPSQGEGGGENILTLSDKLMAQPWSQLPYWCDQQTALESKNKVPRVIDVQAIIDNAVNKSADVNVLLERALVPAICRAFAANRFFSGVSFNALRDDQLSSELKSRLAQFWHKRGEGELWTMLRAHLPRLTQLSLHGSLIKQPMTAVVPGAIRVRVHSMKHLPKMDTFGSCDGYVSVAVSANGQPAGEMQKSAMIKASYNPDFLDKNFGGQVRSLFFNYPAGTNPVCQLTFDVKAMDWERLRKDDFIGNVKFPPMAPGELDQEGWYDVLDPKKGTEVVGKDKEKTLVYMRVTRCDVVNPMNNLRLPDNGRAQGLLTKIDLTCQTLDALALDFILSHAGVLKELRVGGCCLLAGEEAKCASVILKHLLGNIRKPGSAVPEEWKQGAQYVTNRAKALQGGRTVVVQSASTTALPTGWEKKVDPTGKEYYQNHIQKATQWEAPQGKNTVFGCIVEVDKGGACSVDVGQGAPEQCSSDSLGVIDPAYRGWGNAIQVLDVSLLPWDSAWALPSVVMAMPSLVELHMARVNPTGVLEALAAAAQARLWVPALSVLDISQELDPSHPAAAAVTASSAGQPQLDLSCLAPAIGALQPSLKDLRMQGLIALARDPMATLHQVLDQMGGGLADTTVGLGYLANDFAQPLESLVAHTQFSGTISLDGATPQIITAALSGLAHNKTVSGLSVCAGWTGYGGVAHHAVWHPTVRGSLTQLLVNNSTIKTLKLSGANRDSYSQWQPLPASEMQDPVANPLQFITVGLAQNKGLTSVDVEDLCLGDAGGTALGQALRQNRTLLALRLDRNACGLDGWKAFRGCLYGNKKLHECPVPETDFKKLIDALDGTIRAAEQVVMTAKRNIKIACRGGRVKPHLGNPALKARSLEQLRAAKREQGAARRMKAKIEATVPTIWAEIDKNNEKFKAKYAEKVARQEAKRAEQERKRLQQEAKAQWRMNQKFNRWQQTRPQNSNFGGYNRYGQHNRYDDNGAMFYGGAGAAAGYGYGAYGHHHHHHHGGYYHDDYYDDDDNWGEREQFEDAEMEVADLQEQAAFEAEAAAEEEAAAAEETAAAEEEAAGDLADVEAYGGAGPRDLPSGGADRPRPAVRSAGKARGGEGAAERARRLLREWAAAHEEELERVQGSKVLQYETMPGFLGAKEEGGGGEVTLVTQASVDRLGQLERQAKAWGGAVSAAVYVPREETAREEALREVAAVHRRLAESGVRRVAISVLVAREESEQSYDNQYPINALRNLALERADSALVLLLDVDFVPSASLAALCNADTADHRLRLAREGRVALVVAAFEVRAGEQQGCDRLPADVGELGELWEQGKAEGFHVSSFPKGHSATDYARWWAAGAPYEVRYAEHFEPYVIMARRWVPRYDERFRGYGMNKISHLMEVAASGAAFVVLPEVFVAALEHSRSRAWQHAFGPQRDPSHAVRIAYLMGSFKRALADKYGPDVLEGLLQEGDSEGQQDSPSIGPAPALGGEPVQPSDIAPVESRPPLIRLPRSASGSRRRPRLVSQLGPNGSTTTALMLPAPVWALRVALRAKSPPQGKPDQRHTAIAAH